MKINENHWEIVERIRQEPEGCPKLKEGARGELPVHVLRLVGPFDLYSNYC